MNYYLFSTTSIEYQYMFNTMPYVIARNDITSTCMTSYVMAYDVIIGVRKVNVCLSSYLSESSLLWERLMILVCL